MTKIEAMNMVQAPIKVCFRLSLSIDLELRAARDFSIEVVGGVKSGIIGPGERVAWRAKQFGLWIKHTTEITAYEAPVYFQDSMVKGLFRSFHHQHFFHSLSASETEMRDELIFSMPLFLLGAVAEELVVKQRLTTMLFKRNALIQQGAKLEGK